MIQLTCLRSYSEFPHTLLSTVCPFTAQQAKAQNALHYQWFWEQVFVKFACSFINVYQKLTAWGALTPVIVYKCNVCIYSLAQLTQSKIQEQRLPQKVSVALHVLATKTAAVISLGATRFLTPVLRHRWLLPKPELLLPPRRPLDWGHPYRRDLTGQTRACKALPECLLPLLS